MSTTTTNYKLVKPALTDAPPDITAMNPNWDTIDTQLKTLSDNLNNQGAVTPESIGAAKTDLSNVTGTLPVNRGGTGNTSVDTTPTSGSTKMVTSGGVYTALSGKAPTSHGNHVPTTQTADNATFLRNDNTWQKVTPANIGAAESSHGHDLELLGTVKLYRYLEQLNLTDATATTNAIMQAMEGNSIAILDVTTSWTAATEIPSKYSTMVIYKRYNGRTSGTLTAVASEHIWFGSQHSGGSFAGWKEQYGEHNISALATAVGAALGAAKIQTGTYKGAGTYGSSNKNSLTFNFTPKLLLIAAANGSSSWVMWTNNSTGFIQSANMAFNSNKVSFSGNTLTWYYTSSSGTADRQLNTSNATYCWVAIG